MAKRGRPSKKVLQKRKVAKQKGELSVLFAMFVVVLLVVLGYFLISGQIDI